MEIKPVWDHNWEARECATLGTLFADIYCDGEIFAIEVGRKVAERFCKEPWMFGNVYAQTPKLRAWIMETEHDNTLIH